MSVRPLVCLQRPVVLVAWRSAGSLLLLAGCLWLAGRGFSFKLVISFCGEFLLIFLVAMPLGHFTDYHRALREMQ